MGRYWLMLGRYWLLLSRYWLLLLTLMGHAWVMGPLLCAALNIAELYILLLFLVSGAAESQRSNRELRS